jgi:hypothetical protein
MQISTRRLCLSQVYLEENERAGHVPQSFWRTRLLFFMEDLTVAPAKSFCQDISFDIGIMTLYYALS